MKKTCLTSHFKPENFSDYMAYKIVRFTRLLADCFFRKRYGHRAVVLETVAAIPGMVGGMLLHLRCLRKIQDDYGWIKVLLDEAENERMHLMTFIKIAQPNIFERFLIIITQGIFFTLYGILHICSSRTAHRFVGYMEEEAIISYTEYIEEIKSGKLENIQAPEIAIKYWNMSKNSRLLDLIYVIREDEKKHRNVNHEYASILKKPHSKRKLKDPN